MMKIGMVGSGMIVKDCLEALSAFGLETESKKKVVKDIRCSALCVRKQSEEKGQELCKQYGIEKLYTDYQEFLQTSDADFIYIGIVNTEHFSYAKQALLANRHVILEKPFTMTYAEAVELAELAKERKLFLFEAITTLYFPNFEEIKSRLKEIGNIKVIQCNFSQYSSRYDRYLSGEVAPAFDPKLGGGALYDLNIYNIHFVVRLFGEPLQVIYYANRGFNGVDTSGILVMCYEDFVAECVAAKDSSGSNFAMIQGAKGQLKIIGQASICESVEVIQAGVSETINNNQYNHRMQHEFAAFQAVYEEKDLDTCYRTLEHTLQVMKILEGCNVRTKQ